MNDILFDSASDHKIRVLCLGVSPQWVSIWHDRSDVQVVGLVDLYQEIESAAGSQLNPASNQLLDQVSAREIPLFHEILEALTSLKPDIVTMVTPPQAKTRMDAIQTVLLQGYDIYLEKFRPAERQDGEQLLRWSQSLDRQIGIGESYRYDGLVERAKQVIDSGILGDVEQVVWSCYRPNISAAWMKAYQHVMLEDLSYHHLGVIHYLLGVEQFKRIYATSVCPAWSKEASPNVVSLIAHSEAGCQLTYHASWAAQGNWSSWLGDFRIEGSRGVLQLQGNQLVLTELMNNGEGVANELAPVEPYPHDQRAGIVNEFISSRLEKRQTSLHIATVYPVIRMIYAAVESAETGVAIELARTT